MPFLQINNQQYFYQVGDKLPSIDVYEGNPDCKVNIRELFSKRGVLFAVPGAFTPGCSKVIVCTYTRDVQYTVNWQKFAIKNFHRLPKQ